MVTIYGKFRNIYVFYIISNHGWYTYIRKHRYIAKHMYIEISMFLYYMYFYVFPIYR